jgi:hypothetical protein
MVRATVRGIVGESRLVMRRKIVRYDQNTMCATIRNFLSLVFRGSKENRPNTKTKMPTTSGGVK